MDFFEITYPFLISGFHSAYSYQWDNTFTFEGESHNFWEIVCVLSGEVECAEDQNVYILRAGNLICHAPMEFHRIRSSGGTFPSVLVLSFELQGALPQKLSEGIFSLSSIETDEFQSLFSRIYNVVHGDPKDVYLRAETGAALGSFLIRMGQNHQPQNNISHTRQAIEYQKLVETMKNSIYENLSLKELAVRNAISISTIKQLFVNYAGIAPKTYYSRLRARESLRLLDEGKSCAEIANIMNFSSPNHFSSFFKKHFGFSPGQFRKDRIE